MSSPDPSTTADPAAPGTPILSHRQILVVLAGLMLGMLVAALSQTIVATALPIIVGELGGQEQLAWVVSATLLTSTASTPIWGKLSDLLGRKQMFQSAIVIFLLASAAAGFAQDMPQLVGARAVQGVGIGGMMALAQAIIGDVVSPRERGRYQGYLGSVFGLATIAGPLLGGFLVEHLSWRWTFWSALPVGIAALVVVQRAIRFPFPRRRHSIDWLGAFFIVGSVSAVLLALSLGGIQFPWNSAWTYGLVAGSLLMLLAAIWQERRAAEPIMPPRLFTNHTFVITSLAGFIVGIAMFGAIIFLPQYLQIVKDQTPTASGLLTLPLVTGLLVSSIVSGRLITRTGRYKIFPVVGLLTAAVGLGLLSLLHVRTSLVAASGYMLVTGLGLGMVMQVLVLVAQNAVDRQDLGVATSGATFFRTLGGAVGVAVFGALLSYRLPDAIAAALAGTGVPGDLAAARNATAGTPAEIAALPEPIHTAVVTGFAEAFQTAFLAAVPFAVAGFVVVLFLRETRLRWRSTDGGDGAAAPPADSPNGRATTGNGRATTGPAPRACANGRPRPGPAPAVGTGPPEGPGTSGRR